MGVQNRRGRPLLARGNSQEHRPANEQHLGSPRGRRLSFLDGSIRKKSWLPATLVVAFYAAYGTIYVFILQERLVTTTVNNQFRKLGPLNPSDQERVVEGEGNRLATKPHVVQVQLGTDFSIVQETREKSDVLNVEESSKETSDGKVWAPSTSDLTTTGASHATRSNKHQSSQPPLRANSKPNCVRMEPWQSSSHPSCLVFHELDMNHLSDTSRNATHLEIVGSGSFRDTWKIRDFDGTPRALKTLRLIHKRTFDPYTYDRHRRDAVVSEQLAASPHVANIYGYCGNSALYDLGHLTLSDRILNGKNPPLSERDRLVIARDAAAAVADFHHVNNLGIATMIHNDIKPDQYINFDGKYKLNDFNAAEFFFWNPISKQRCGFRRTVNKGIWRSPEEYRLDYETEKVDVWNLGLVLYFILTGKRPYGATADDGDVLTQKVKDFLIGGGRAVVTDDSILNSTHPFHKALLRAIDLCLVHDPTKRPTARHVANLLEKALLSLERETSFP